MANTDGKYESKVVSPEEMGWVFVKDDDGRKIYKRPDGQLHTFPKGQIPSLTVNTFIPVEAPPKHRPGSGPLPGNTEKRNG